jgi:hypothetical protein
MNLVRKRRKLGFVAPEADFLGGLGPMIREAFANNPRSGALLDAELVLRSLVNGHTPPVYSWRFFNLELWMRVYGLRV